MQEAAPQFEALQARRKAVCERLGSLEDKLRGLVSSAPPHPPMTLRAAHTWAVLGTQMHGKFQAATIETAMQNIMVAAGIKAQGNREELVRKTQATLKALLLDSIEQAPPQPAPPHSSSCSRPTSPQFVSAPLSPRPTPLAEVDRAQAARRGGAECSC